MSDLHRQTKQYARIFDQQLAFYEAYARRHGLQSKGLYMLMWIYYNPQGITQKRISEKTYASKQVVNATIKKFIEKGYLTCKENPQDKRHKLLTLTEAGRSYASAILDPLEALEMKAMQVLSDEEQTLFLQLSERYSQSITALFLKEEGGIYD